MAKCTECLWGDQCHTEKNECSDYTPVDEYADLDEEIERGLYEFRRAWMIYTKDNGE